MKSEAIKRINQLQSEEAIKAVLMQLEILHSDKEFEKLSADDVFEEALNKYDNLLKRLA